MFGIDTNQVRAALTLLAIFCVLGLFFHLERGGLLSSFDTTLKTLRYELTSRAPSGEVVMVEIDSQSLLELDSWPWPRAYHAQALDNLMEWGADEVVFDVDFSSISNIQNDTAFAQALERAGGYAYLAAFDQISGITRQTLRSQPQPLFAQYANAVLVNINLNQEGMATSFPAFSTGGQARIASLATTLGKPQSATPANIFFDFRIDVNKIDRVSFADVYRGDVNADRFAGKQVLIGASAIELRDFFKTPRFDVIPGPLLQVLGLETVKSGNYISDLGIWPAVGWIFASLVLGILVLANLGRTALLMLGLATMIGGEIAAVALLNFADVSVNTSIVMFVVPTALAIEMMSAATLWLKQRQAMQKRLEYLATHDEITGAYSHAGFVAKVDKKYRNASDLTIALVAIKRLNIVRGALGKKVTDDTLRKIVERAKSISDRPIGVVSPSVFAVSFGEKLDSAAHEEMLADSLLKLQEPYSVAGHTILIDAEIALAHRETQDEPAEQTINNARIAMEGQTAQRTQHHGFKLYAPNLGLNIAKRQQLDIKMRNAIANKEFRLAYQPQIDLKTGRLTGVEALIRWQSPEGPISPGEFIGLAEETGFVVQLGTWVIEEACRITSQWGWTGILSVNVSPLQLDLSDVPAITRRALKQFSYPAERLCLEITESVLVENGDGVLNTMRTFQEMGCTVAIDDFGTGYSSLSYLSELPFDKLKIDQSFVRGIAQNSSNQTIVQTIVDLSHKLGKSVIAEGIETQDEAKILRETGCEIGQGYYFARPVDALTLTKILAAKASQKSA